MKAVHLESTGPLGAASLALGTAADPKPGPGEAAVRLTACGVCRTDLHILEGDIAAPSLPLILGHQAVGVVESLGPGCRRLKGGDRVGIPWLWSACGACPRCRGGRENLCDEARFTGFHVQGGFAERMLVREDFAHPLPEGLSDAQAAPLLCAGAVGWRALRLAGVPDGPLGLFGFGSSAHLVLQLARARGFEVCAFSRGEARRALARKLGAAWAGAPGEKPPAALGAGIVFAPAGELVLPALAALAKGGRLVLAGATMTPVPRLTYDLIYHERALMTVANVTREDVRETLAAAARGEVVAEVTTFPLEAAGRALALIKEGGLSGSAVLTVKGR